MKEQLELLKQKILTEIQGVENIEDLNEIKVRNLGKKGPITEISRNLGNLSPEERPKVGQFINELRESIQEILKSKEEVIRKDMISHIIKEETIDVTLPGMPLVYGNSHPLTRVIDEIEDIFIGMGFEIAEGPEVEKDYYNFEALNLPKGHPARDMHDSFYITEEILLRTHTSPVQIRTMLGKKGEGPVKIICPGKVYRRDDDDATHSHQFTQVEGLVVDENVTMSDLKGLLLNFAKKMYGDNTKIRLRPSFFPFTEPSAEVDVSCFCQGKGCRICKGTGWIEILGAGMVHPKVLENSGFDTNKYTGYAFGLGIERITMIKYGIEDIRHFFTNDLRFLEQFKLM
ncbi:MAG: phenylalanine--tRNA ligase subunit alpha [Vulcanibacillus sp.]